MIEGDLDDIIKNKIQGHEENYDANSWQSLMDKMDQAGLTDDTGSFDETVREKLGNHQEHYDQASWAQLSSKMDEANPIGEEDEINEIKEQLLAHQETVIDSHWQILKAELEALEQRRYRLWGTKAMEAVIMLLLLWTFTNFSALITPEQIDIDFTPQDYAVDPSYESEQFWIYQNSDRFTVVDNLSASEAKQDFDVPVEITSSLINVNDQVGFTNSIVSGVDRSIGLYKSELSTSINNNIDKPVSASSADDSHLTDELSADLLTTVDSDELILLETGLIDPLDIVIAHDHPNLDLSAFDEKEDKSYRSKNDGWWFGANYSADINLINSGFNLGFVTSQLSSGLLGHTGGVSLSWQKGIVEIQSGVRLSRKAHSPGLLRSFTQASDFSVLEHNLELIEFSQAQIPLTVKLHALNASKNHIYGFVGVASNTILGYDFTIEKTVQPSARVRPTDLDAAIVDLTDLPEGFAQGGSLRYNTNFTGVIGFGVESSIDDKVSFFVQPQYQHQFGGQLNNYVSRIGTISVETGVKLKF